MRKTPEQIVREQLRMLQEQWAKEFPHEEDEVTPEIIEQRKAEIQAGWDERTRRARAGVNAPIEWELPSPETKGVKGAKKQPTD